MRYPTFMKQDFGTVFQDGTKAIDKTGTVYFGKAGGYRPVVSNKGFYYNQSSGIPVVK